MNGKIIIRKIIPISYLRRHRFFRILHNIRVKKIDLDNLISEAYSRNKDVNLSEKQFNDYLTDANKYLVSFDEYFYQFKFWRLNEDEKEQFMSQLRLRLLYNELLNPEIEYIFWNKVDFLRKFRNFVFRDWCEISKCTLEQFLTFVKGRDIIIKPIQSARGEGIFKISKDSNEEELQQYFYKIKKGIYLAEECIYNNDEIRQFHPNSLNTIRVVTVKGKNEDINILGALIRFGTGGNVVDNGGHDGILAKIDVEHGIIYTDGYTKQGKKYIYHPDTQVKFKGFKIDNFKDIIKVCKRAAKIVPQVKIVGWDIVQRDNGTVELIEGNQRPDACGLQMTIQKGYKKNLYHYLK